MEPEAIKILVDILSSSEVSPINRSIVSDEAMTRGKELLKHCLSHSKDTDIKDS